MHVCQTTERIYSSITSKSTSIHTCTLGAFQELTRRGFEVSWTSISGHNVGAPVQSSASHLQTNSWPTWCMQIISNNLMHAANIFSSY